MPNPNRNEDVGQLRLPQQPRVNDATHCVPMLFALMRTEAGEGITSVFECTIDQLDMLLGVLMLVHVGIMTAA